MPDHSWRARRLAIAALMGLALLAACVDPDDPNRDPEVRWAFATMQPFTDAIMAEQARTGRYPEDVDALFFEREWPGFRIERGSGEAPIIGEDDWAIVSPAKVPDMRIAVGYRSSVDDARITLFGYGKNCGWYSYHARWGCQSNP